MEDNELMEKFRQEYEYKYFKLYLQTDHFKKKIEVLE